MQNLPPHLDHEYNVDTPENVTFAYDVAGIGNRFIAALIDSVLILLALSLLNLIIFVSISLIESPAIDLPASDDAPGWISGLLIALYILVNFVIFWGYYVLFEYLWNGQTPGKRVVKIRVLRTDGNPAGFIESVIRNLVRVVDFLPSGYGLGLVIMFFNKEARRLGDFAAGTLVVKDRSENTLTLITPPKMTSAAAVDEALLLRYVHIRRLSAEDFELVQDAVNRMANGGITRNLLYRLAQVIALKLEVEPPSVTNAKAFLSEVLRAYRQIG